MAARKTRETRTDADRIALGYAPRMTLWLTTEAHDALTELAKREGLSRPKAIEYAIFQAVSRNRQALRKKESK